MKKLTPELAEILGLLCAEGHHALYYPSYWGIDRRKPRFYKNKKSERIEVYNKDVKLLKHYQRLLAKEFNYESRITKHGKVNIGNRTIIRDIIAYTELGNLKWIVPKKVSNANKNVKIAFLRGFFDGDRTASNRVRMFSTNKNGLLQISDIITDLGIKHTFQGPILKENRKPLYIIQISETEKESFLNKLKPISKLTSLKRG